MPDSIPQEHAYTCGTCGLVFDLRDLDQVIAHEHAGLREATMNPHTDLPLWLWDAYGRTPGLVVALLKRGRPLRCYRPAVLHMLEDVLTPDAKDVERIRAAEEAFRKERMHHGWRMARASQAYIRHRVLCAHEATGRWCAVWDPGVSKWPRVARILNHCLNREGGVYKWMRAPVYGFGP